MRSAILLSGLAGLAAATPIIPRQSGFDFDQIDAAPKPAVQGPPPFTESDPVDYNPSAAAASAAAAASTDPPSVSSRSIKVKRDDCQSQPAGAGPTTSPDTDSAFLSNDVYPSTASSASTPQGYSSSFTALQGAVEGPPYLGYYTLSSYDTVKCQEYCDAAPACYGINVYFERDASVIPADSCPNPPSTVNIKCSLWGSPVNSGAATNVGQWQDQFHVVISGSNGYSKNAAPPSYTNFTGPEELGGAIVGSGYIGSSFFSGPYDPSQCAAACQAQTEFDKEHIVHSDGTYDACNYFNSFVLSDNNVPQGTECQYYTSPQDKSLSTNYGQYRGNDYWSVSSSYGYSLSPQDPGHV